MVMRTIKILLFFIIILFVSLPKITGAENPLTVLFENRLTVPAVYGIEKDGRLFVNLPLLNNYLNIVVAHDYGKSDVFLKAGKINIKLYSNNSTYYINQKSQKLLTAPFEKDGQFWLPLEFLVKLGLAVKSRAQGELSLGWDRNYLLDVENVRYQNHPAILLIGSGELWAEELPSEEPGRLSLKLPGVNAHFGLDGRLSDNPYVGQVQFNQSEDSLKLNFDLKVKTGHRLVRDPERPTGLLIVFPNLLENVSATHQDGMGLISVKTTFPADYQVITQSEKRVVIDFHESSLITEVNSLITENANWIGGMRLSQTAPETVRLELELLEPGLSMINRSRDNPGVLEIRTAQSINRITGIETKAGSRLIIRADRKLNVHLRSGFPRELLMEINDTCVAADLVLPKIPNGLIKEVQLETINLQLVHLKINLAEYCDYVSGLSPDGRELTLTFKRSWLIEKTIILDPGHGGDDLGACGRQGTLEKENNLEITLRLKDLLEQAGAKVVLTRTGDYFVSLYERAYLANYLNADLFISIHTNNHPDRKINGIEIFLTRRKAKLLANKVFEQLTQATGLKGLKVKKADFAVIRETQMPGILVEVGFLSNYQEETIMRTPEFRKNAAEGIFRGVRSYFRE